MRLTLWTDYALRTLIYLGTKRGLATIDEIAGNFDIANTHLTKVVNKLSRQGYVESFRGRAGGIRLGREPELIRVGAVVRDTEEELAVMGCLEAARFCRIDGCCVLRGALRKATEAFLQTLDNYTLADLLTPHVRLAESLKIKREPLARSRGYRGIS